VSVSVITPTIRGREWFLSRARASVRWQTHPNVRHIVANGNGLTATEAFQSALEHVETEFVLPLSDDDWLAPHCIESLRSIIGNNELAIGRMLITSPSGDRIMQMGGACLWRTSLTDRIGGFNTRYRFAGDTELYARFSYELESLSSTPECLYFFTEHAHHGSHINREALAEELREIESLYPAATQRMQSLITQSNPTYPY
jgi:hypothetical protein